MTKADLYEKYPALQAVDYIPESHACCWGCATQYVASLCGWDAAYEWEGFFWPRFHSPGDVS